MGKAEKQMIGRTEWVTLPGLGLPAIKAKTDTGAASSALHATYITEFDKEGSAWVRFRVRPFPDDNSVSIPCEAPVKEIRPITSSNGQKEKRYVIETEMKIGASRFFTEITLTNRRLMRYRMLLGMKSIREMQALVDVSKIFIQGRIKNAKQLYLEGETTP